MAYRAILFDMDGVLIESEDLMTKAGILALADFGVQAQPEDFIPFVGRGEDLYIGGVAEKYGVPYDVAMKQRCYDYVGMYVEEDATVPEGLLDILTEIKNRGIRIVICTSADWEKARHNMRAMKTDREFFDGIVTGDMITNKKPDPEIYLKGAELAGASPEDCLVVEDAPSGIEAGHRAGMKVVGITSSFTEEHLKSHGGPDVIIHQMRELLEVI